MTAAPIVLSLVGPTASGKSAVALDLARRHPDLDLVSVDSMQVYRGMDIGTAKPSAAEQAEVRHHLIDLADPSEDYTVARYQIDLADALDEIGRAGRRAVLVGGTGLYLRAAIDDLEIPGRFPEVRAELEQEPDTEALHRRLAELDPTAAGRMEPGNRRRVLRALEVTVGSGRPFSSYGPGMLTYPPVTFPIVGLRLDRPELDQRIVDRYQAQLAAGFVDEVAAIDAQPGGFSPTAAQALGYREILEHLHRASSLDDAIEHAVTRTRRFARRQERWFRRDPRLTWVDGGQNAFASIDALLGD